MHNLALIIVLADQRRRQCPCGAVTERPGGLCRKCQARNAWRRKTTPARRKSARRRLSRRSRNAASFLAGVLTPLKVPATSNGLEG